MTAVESFAEVRAAAIDGRAHNVYYRQHQLEALHEGLLTNASEIQEAIAADYGHTTAEIAVEIRLALLALKNNYETLQPAKAHTDEYLIASEKDAPNNRVPTGIVYIEPCMHTLFYSIVAPLSAAIAGGNCVILLLEKNLRSLTSVLRRTLQQALHPDTFAIAESPVRDPTIIASALVVDQKSSIDTRLTENALVSPSGGLVYAVVDRTADIELAAKELVVGRFAFKGKSPYAPDLVLVNEFVKETFLQAVIAESRKLSAARTERKGETGKAAGEIEKFRKMDVNVEIVLEDGDAVVLDLLTRNPQLLETKTEAPILPVHGFKSLDDAINFLSRARAGPALAAYHFGNPQVGKYLAQFVDARNSFVNHIPRDWLVGPARPQTAFRDSSLVYTVDMFTLHRPALIQPSVSSAEIAAALSSTTSFAADALLKQALSPLNIMKRKAGSGIGFFEQGLLVNVGMILTAIISVTATGTFWLVRNGQFASIRWRI